MLVHDPAARTLEAGGWIVFGDGRMQSEIDLSSSVTREALSGFSRARLDRIIDWQSEINLSVLP